MSSFFNISTKNSAESKIQAYLQLIVLVAIGFFELKNSHIRMSYGDAPFCFFQLVVEKNFWVPHERYTGYLMEWLAVLGLKLNWDYRIIFYSFAIGNFLTSSLLIGIYHYFTRDSRGVWVLILSLIMGMSSSYYAYTVDQYLGYVMSVFSILVIARLIKSQEKLACVFMFFFCAICILSNLYHCILLFVGLTYILLENRTKYKYILIQYAIIIVVLVLIKKLLPSSAYEQGRLNILKGNLIHIHELDKAAFQYYFNSIFGNYRPLHYLYGIIIFMGLIRRKFLELLLGIGVYFFLYYLNCLYNFSWESNAYMDLYGRAIFISILLCFYFIIKESNVHWIIVSAIFLFILYINASLIFQKYEAYHNRYEYLSEWLDHMEEKGVKKLAIDEKQLNYEVLLLDWALPYETLVMSTFLNRPSTICAKDIEARDKRLWKKDVLYARFSQEPYSRIEHTEFRELPRNAYVFILDSMDGL